MCAVITTVATQAEIDSYLWKLTTTYRKTDSYLGYAAVNRQLLTAKSTVTYRIVLSQAGPQYIYSNIYSTGHLLSVLLRKRAPVKLDLDYRNIINPGAV